MKWFTYVGIGAAILAGYGAVFGGLYYATNDRRIHMRECKMYIAVNREGTPEWIADTLCKATWEDVDLLSYITGDEYDDSTFNDGLGFEI